MLVGLTIAKVFFFNDTATTEIYTLSLHDALPISTASRQAWIARRGKLPQCLTRFSRSSAMANRNSPSTRIAAELRSEEHTSELQSRQYLVCRLLLEKKKSSITSRKGFQRSWSLRN